MVNLNQLDKRITKILDYVEKSYELSSKEKTTLIERLWTFASKVRQPRKDDRSCNKTPYFNRWDTNTTTSYITKKDPRYATRTECELVILKLLTLLLEVNGISLNFQIDNNLVKNILGRNLMPNSLVCGVTNKKITKEDITKSLKYATQRLGSYNIPVTYIKELNKGGTHNHKNVTWMKPVHINYKLREDLKQKMIQSGAPPKAVKNALDKIQVKSYCTDKVTMPLFFSNRDVRWATWTNSFQYASHYECSMIELELMSELYEFKNAPSLKEELKNEISVIRQKPFQANSRKCYITGKILNFKEYLDASINTKGGKSAHHVGHKIPLTRGGKHEHSNIAWISDDGNRIQGNNTIEEIEEKLIDSVIYYLQRKNKFIPKIIEKLLKLNKMISLKIKK